MYNFSELKNNTAVILQRSSDDDYKTEIGHWINISMMTLYNYYDYYLALRNTYNFTTVDGTALYYMPSDFEKPFRVYDITNNNKLVIRTEDKYFDSNIANIADANESNANTLYFKEVVGVKVQVATTGDTVKAVSSNAADTAIVRVEGYLDSALSILGYENITLNGTTAVAGLTTFYKILHFSKSADTTGYVSLTDSSDVTLGVLGQNERVARYKAFRLGLIPDDSVTSMRVLYKKRFTKLVEDNDYPFIECDDYLIYNAASLGLQQSKESLERGVIFNQLAAQSLKTLILSQMSQNGPDFQHMIETPLIRAHRA